MNNQGTSVLVASLGNVNFKYTYTYVHTLVKGASEIFGIWQEIILDISYDNFQCSFPYINVLLHSLDDACGATHM